MSMQNGGFVPRGNTITISAPTAAPPAGVQVPTFSGDVAGQGQMVFRIRNTSLSNDVYVGYGNTAAEATTNSAVPPAKMVGLSPGQTELLTLNAGTYFSALAISAATGVQITPGDIS